MGKFRRDVAAIAKPSLFVCDFVLFGLGGPQGTCATGGFSLPKNPFVDRLWSSDCGSNDKIRRLSGSGIACCAAGLVAVAGLCGLVCVLFCIIWVSFA